MYAKISRMLNNMHFYLIMFKNKTYLLTNL